MDFTQLWTLDNDGTIKELGIRLNPHMQRMVLSADGSKHRKAIWEAREKVATKKKELQEAAIKSNTEQSSQTRSLPIPCKSCGKKREQAAFQKDESK